MNTLHYRGKNVRPDQGRWEYGHTISQGDGSITFYHFRFGLSGYGMNVPGFWEVKLERTRSGRLGLCLDPDLGRYFLKEKTRRGEGDHTAGA